MGSGFEAECPALRAQIDAALTDLVSVCQVAEGPAVARVEQAVAACCGTSAAVAMNCGAAALRLALAALEIVPGDEVIVPALGPAGAVEAIAERRARIVFADVHANTGAIDPRTAERCLSRRTRAMLAVHLFGHAADVEALWALAAHAGARIALIEDAGAALGARRNGRAVGGMGTVGCFGFAHGGALTTNDLRLARRLRQLADEGACGDAERLSPVQAGMLTVRLAHVQEQNRRRRALAGLYHQILERAPGVALPVTPPGTEPACDGYAIRVEDRRGLQDFLARRDLAPGEHGPIALHREAALLELDHVAGPLPLTQRWADQMLVLPLEPEMSEARVCEIAEAVREFQGRDRSAAEPPARVERRKPGRDRPDGI